MKETQKATFGSGCFWCVEAVFERLDGVIDVIPGYSGGHKKNPTYREICTGTTGHAEVAQITFDPKIIGFNDLLNMFWKSHDPTTRNRQGNDIGTQYRSAIFYHNDVQKLLAEESKLKVDKSRIFTNPIVTEITKLDKFWPAEDYHNNYYANNGTPPVVPLPSRAPPSHSSVDNKTISPLQSSAAGIPDHILKRMPPNVQKIAKRRPDLVATIWKQKQAQQQQQQRLSSKSNAGLSKQRYNNTGLAALPERNIEEQNRADAMDEEFDSDNEDETTSLIHRDEIPGRYKAVDKSMYPSIL